MTSRERYKSILEFRKPDRLPFTEWAPWWDKTLDRWAEEGLARDMPHYERFAYFGLEPMDALHAAPWLPPAPYHGAAVITSEAQYDEMRGEIFSDEHIRKSCERALELKARHEADETSTRFTVNGFFWFPRRCFGIEPHLFAFYDHAELMKRMCADLLAFNMRGISAVTDIVAPDIFHISEDMSYNNGPMLSEEMFREFIRPYYKVLIPHCKKCGLKVFIDTDGDVAPMIPWLVESGADGILPLERQAGVDIVQIRRDYPGLLLFGGFDKMVMNRGEAAIHAEFERILPVIRSGGYIPGVDHQTPPGVSLEQFKCFVRVLKEYTQKC